MCFIEQENDLVKLFLALMMEVSSLSTLKEFYDGTYIKQKRRKTKDMRLSIIGSHLFFFALQYGRRQARICACVDIRPNCFSLCVCVSYEQKHTSPSSSSSGFFCLFNASFLTSDCLKQTFKEEAKIRFFYHYPSIRFC